MGLFVRAARTIALSAVLASALVPVGTSALAAPTGAPGADRPVQAAAEVATIEQQYAKLDYEQANIGAERVAQKGRGLTLSELVRTYKVLAVTHAVLDHADQAREAFVMLLTIDPSYAVDPNLGPKVQTPFLEARGFWRAQGTKPGLEMAAVVRGTEPGTLRVTTRDPTRLVRTINVGFRWGSVGPFTLSAIVVGDGVAVEVPGAPAGKSRLDYYAQAVDEHDNVLFEVGRPTMPRSAFVDARPIAGKAKADEASPLFASPLFWLATAAVLAGGATAGYFAFRPGPPVAATYRSALDCGGARCP